MATQFKIQALVFGAALIGVAPQVAHASDLSESERLAIAGRRACEAMKDGADPAAKLADLQVLSAPADDLATQAGLGKDTAVALRTMGEAAFALRPTPDSCAIVFAADNAGAREEALRVLGAGAKQAAAAAPSAPPPLPVAPVAVATPIVATPAVTTPIVATPAVVMPPAIDARALADSFAPLSTARAALEVCGQGLRGGDVAAAAARLGLKADKPSGYALPNAADDGAVFRVPSRDGEIWVYTKPEDPKTCNVAVAMAPPPTGGMVADILSKEGMAVGREGDVDPRTHFRQLTSADGRMWVNLVTFQAPEGAAMPVRTYLQIGSH